MITMITDCTLNFVFYFSGEVPQDNVLNKENQADSHCYLEVKKLLVFRERCPSFTSRLKMKYDFFASKTHQLTKFELLGRRVTLKYQLF